MNCFRAGSHGEDSVLTGQNFSQKVVGDTDRHVVTLTNWAYSQTKGKKSAIVPLTDPGVTIAHAGPVREVTSAMLGKELPLRPDSRGISVILPRLEKGDVLLLERPRAATRAAGPNDAHRSA